MPWLRAATAARLAAIEEATDSRVVMAAAEHSPESAELPLPEDGGLCNNRGYVRDSRGNQYTIIYQYPLNKICCGS